MFFSTRGFIPLLLRVMFQFVIIGIVDVALIDRIKFNSASTKLSMPIALRRKTTLYNLK